MAGDDQGVHLDKDIYDMAQDVGRRALARRGYLHHPRMAVAALRWFDAGKIGFALHGALPVTVFSGDAHEFGITTPPRSLIGDDVLIAAMPGDPVAIMRHYASRFAGIERIPPIAITHHGRVLLRIPMLLGHDMLSWPGVAPNELAAKENSHE